MKDSPEKLNDEGTSTWKEFGYYIIQSIKHNNERIDDIEKDIKSLREWRVSAESFMIRHEEGKKSNWDLTRDFITAFGWLVMAGLIVWQILSK